MNTSASYTRLTHGKKQAMCDHFAADSTMTRRQLSRWVVAMFKMFRLPSRTTLHRILKEVQNDQKRSPARKTARSVNCTLSDAMLTEWIRRHEVWKLSIVTGATIHERAAKIRDEFIATVSPSTTRALSSMVLSNGWLDKFQKCHNLRSKRIYGEAALVNMSTVEKRRIAPQQITKAYS